MKVFAICLILQSYLFAQTIDTLKYYTEYDPDSLNTVAFVAECFQPGWCEPIGVRFEPNVSEADTTFRFYSIKELRFCFGQKLDNTAFSVHLGSDYPGETNRIYRKPITVDTGDVNYNFYTDGEYLFTNFDVSDIAELKNLRLDENFWLVLEAKVWGLHNTNNDVIKFFGSKHSFVAGLPTGNWETAYCDWIVEAVVVYHQDIIDNIDQRNVISIPKAVSLFPGYPNPFNNSTKFAFDVNTRNSVSLKIYNTVGKEVRTLIKSKLYGPGLHEVYWNGLDNNGEEVNSGLYIVVIKSSEVSVSRKIIKIK